MKSVRIAIIAAVLAAAVPAGAALAQGQSNTLRGSIAAQFNQEDFDLLYAAAGEAIKGNKKGAKKSWHNPKTGNSGVVSLIRAFTSTDGRECAKLRIENRSKGKSGVSAQNVCHSADKGWLFDAGAVPAEVPAASPP